MKHLMQRPLLIWLLGSALSLLLLVVQGGLVPRVTGDTASYRDIDWSSPAGALSNPRTLAYPLFLRCADALAPNGAAVPWLHWGCHITGVGIFLWGLLCAGFRPPIAVAAACPLLVSRVVWQFVPQVIGDSLAVSLCLASAGCLFAYLGQQRTWTGLAGASLLTFLAYQVRPAYVFLILFWPLLAVVTDRTLFHRGDDEKRFGRRMGWLLVGMGAPFISFCTLRWSLVGHWGLVSFGGMNVIGITAQFMDEQVVLALPDDLQPLGRAILDRRRRLPSFGDQRNFAAMEAAYNPVVYQAVLPAARVIYPDDPVALNDALTRLSHHVIRLRPSDYAYWLVENSKHAVMQAHLLLLLDPAVGLLVMIWLVAHGWNLYRGPGSETPTTLGGPPVARFREDHLLVWTALGFVSAKSMLVVLVEPAIGRYMTAANLFLPTALGVWVGRYLERS